MKGFGYSFGCNGGGGVFDRIKRLTKKKNTNPRDEAMGNTVFIQKSESGTGRNGEVHPATKSTVPIT